MLNWRELKMIDIANPEHQVEVLIKPSIPGQLTLWVNVDGICQLRITNIKPEIIKLPEISEE